MCSAVIQAFLGKYLFFLTIICAARTFTGAFITEERNAPEHALSFLDGFVEGDFMQQKRVVKRDVSVRPSVPQYMLDMYERLENKNLKVNFDIVRSLSCEGISKIKDPHNSWSKSSTSSNWYKLIFDVSRFPHSEYALLAQLRIQGRRLLEKGFETTKIDIYSLLENPPTLLSSRVFYPNTEHLYTVDITNMFHQALYSNEKHLLFGLSITKGFEDFLIMDSMSTEGPQLLLMSKTNTPRTVHEDEKLSRMKRSPKVFETTLTEGNFSRKDMYEILPKHDSSEDISRHSEQKEEEAKKPSTSLVDKLGRIGRKLRSKKSPCHREPLEVNFTTINYSKRIVAPSSYEAFQCTGHCSVPSDVPSTQHAIIQTLLHGLDPKQVSRACCVPTKLTPISVMYIDEDGSIIFEMEYKEMVVAKCGCR